MTEPNCCDGRTADGDATILLEKAAAAAGAVKSLVVKVTRRSTRTPADDCVAPTILHDQIDTLEL